VKAIRSNIKISPHGGVVPILKKIKEFGIPQVIRACLGKRKEQSKYGYEDVFIAWVLTTLCGGTRLEHISKLKKKLNIIPGLKLPSHDTLGRVMKQLATEIQIKRNLGNNSDVYTHSNENIELNRMLIKATKRMGALQEAKSYTMHIDATFIPTECRGAIRKRNKEGKVELAKIGFNPMVCLIDELPVFVSMRDGYANSSFEFNSCLQNSLKLLEESKVKIGRLISDAAGYNKDAFEMLNNKGIKFIVRFPYRSKMETFNSALQNCSKWRKVEISTANFNWDCEVGDVPYKMHDHYSLNYVSPTWRVVAMRMPIIEFDKDARDNKDINERKLNQLRKSNRLKGDSKPNTEGKWITIGDYKYKFIVTNDYKKPAEELILEFNKRGYAERIFSFMKQDYAWRLPPFMNMNENTVFMIAAALANNVFRGVVKLFKKKLPWIRLNTRIRDFQYVFINVACAYIDKTYIFYNTDIEYELLI
jgi:hypothetical protein